jgi:hydroxypyruvate reductase
MDGEAREAGRLIASVLADSSEGRTSFGRRTCLLAGGETTVTVRGRNSGGRNSEAALAAAIRLSGVAGVAVGFLATDGDDGTTGAAGAIVDGATVDATTRTEAIQVLADNDSFTFLSGRGAKVITGPTGTNVNDLVIGLVA